MQRAAMQQAQQQISISEQPILDQIQQERAANLAKARSQMGFSKAAAAIMQQAAPAVGDAYSNAANADAGYSRALGSGVQAQLDQSQQANNDFLQKMGTPSAALQQAPPVGDVSYGLQGYIPATSLQREGAGWESAAQMMPGNLLHAGQQESQQILSNDPNLVTLQNDLAKLAATQPAVYQSILKSFQDQAYKQSQLGLSQARLNLSSQLGYARLQQGQQRINQSAFNSDRNYRLALKRIGISNRSLQLRAAAAEAKAQGGGYSSSQIARFKSTAASMATALWNGVPKSTKGPGAPKQSYKFAMKYLLTHGIPPSIADHELRAAGYHQGDGRGTPKEVNFGMGGGGPFGAGGAGETVAAQKITDLAYQYLGTPYVWGGASPKGFDCSGFAQYLYRQAGISIPRTTYTQWQAGRPIGKGQLQPGDLVFFRGSDSRGGLPGHVGVYIGNGQMIDEPHTGSSARIESVAGFPGYMGARRYGNG